MSNDEPIPSREVRFTPEFKRNLRHLARKYRHIRSDIQPVIDMLIAGGSPGDRIQGVDLVIYKVRIRNTDAQRGKSGGYRMVYYERRDDIDILITLYSKTEQQDIQPHEILAILAEEDTDLLQ